MALRVVRVAVNQHVLLLQRNKQRTLAPLGAATRVLLTPDQCCCASSMIALSLVITDCACVLVAAPVVQFSSL